MYHIPSRSSQCDKTENIIPENCVGNPECAVCNGKGYVFKDSYIARDRDYSKSKRGKEIWVFRVFHKQCPVCDPANKLIPLTDCPLCRGVHTNDHQCPYCDMIYNNWPEGRKDHDGVMRFTFVGTNGNSPMSKKGWLKFIGTEINNRCNPFKKENPEDFQFHPLAVAYRRVLREIWSI